MLKYLFPFELIEKNSRIVIYGAGTIGRVYVNQLLEANYCTLVSVVDLHADGLYSEKIKIGKPDLLKKINFDYVIIAIKDEEIANTVRRELEQVYDINSKKIANGYKFSDIDFPDGSDRMLIYAFFFGRYWHIPDYISNQLLNRLRKSKQVVVYGAGTVGRDVIHLLESYGINQIIMAVSKKGGSRVLLMGYEVQEIDKLNISPKECLVLLSAVKRHQTDMINYLENNGFSDYVCMT